MIFVQREAAPGRARVHTQTYTRVCVCACVCVCWGVVRGGDARARMHTQVCVWASVV